MSITATISPPALCLSRNQIPLRLNAPDAMATTGALGAYIQIWGAPDTIGDTMKYTWVYDGKNYEVTFTMKAASDVEANEVQVFSGSGEPAFKTWMETILIPILLAHPDINQFFTIAYAAPPSLLGALSMRLRAPYYGNLAFAGLATGFTSSIIENTVGVAPVPAINYAARIIVSIAPLATSALTAYIRLPEIQGYPNAAGQIDIDLQPLIEPYFRKSDLPTLPMPNEIKVLDSAPRTVKVEYAQQSGDPLTRSHFKNVTTKVLQGGVASHDWTALRADLQAWMKIDGAGQRFLTNRKIQRIYPGQPQYLHWYHVLPTILSTTTVIFTPKPTGASYTLTAGATPLAERIHRIPVNASQYTGTTIENTKYYEVMLNYWLPPGLPLFSEKIQFQVMPRPTGLTVIEYQNQWGVPETIALPWSRQRIATITKDSYERTLPLNYAITDSTRKTLAEQLTDTFDLSIPANDKIDGPHIPELLLSPETYIIVDGTTRIPCTIEAGSINQESQSRRGQQWPQHSLKITLERQISWSRIINLTDLCQ